MAFTKENPLVRAGGFKKKRQTAPRAAQRMIFAVGYAIAYLQHLMVGKELLELTPFRLKVLSLGPFFLKDVFLEKNTFWERLTDDFLNPLASFRRGTTYYTS